MSKFTMIVLAIGAVLVMAIMGSYNGITRKEEAVFHAWGNLDSSLQRRFDLIPNLVGAVKGYATHENKTLQAVVEARSQIGKMQVNVNDQKSIAQFMAKQGELQSALNKLMVVVESYPDLKANANFLDLQHQLEGTENRINYARNQMNNAVLDFNSTIRRFPTSLVNAIFAHCEKKAFFQTTEEAKAAPKVDFNNG